MTKTGNDGWDAGAASTQSIPSGDGYVDFTATETNKHRRVGLSHGDANQSYDDIDFCIYLSADGTVNINEGSTSRGSFGSYASGDVFRVGVENGVVKYRRNGALLYTSTITPTYPLLVDTSLYSTSSTISNVVVASSQGTVNLNWLVTDQLGTPRMIFDQTGSLANVKRHDYLPFGEELSSVNGLRSSVVGFTGDQIRQKFTSKERDTETGLDYFLARYYSSGQGRFISPDEFTGGPEELYFFADDASTNPTFYSDLTVPQSLNKYQYVYNNPLRYTDDDGHCGVLCVWAIRAGAAGAGAAARSPVGQRVITTAGAAATTVIVAVSGVGKAVLDHGGQSAMRQDMEDLRSLRRNNQNVFSKAEAGAEGATNDDGQPYEDTAENRERMNQGKAPIGRDGKPVELHHPGQENNAPTREMTQTDHRGKGNYSANHPKGNQQPSEIDRNKANKDRRKYWKEKGKENQKQ